MKQDKKMQQNKQSPVCHINRKTSLTSSIEAKLSKLQQIECFSLNCAVLLVLPWDYVCFCIFKLKEKISNTGLYLLVLKYKYESMN